ncbi:sensor histidine kinase [Geodermatophilus sp. CPCC 206100]|uniref:sensor histidine kinase n=1 Tax=Geodermatophilus sp. CPCC 206100 TaxID=3020054 RepID=UPI003B005D6B
MTLAANPSPLVLTTGLLPALRRLVRGRRRRPDPAGSVRPTPPEALVRALCHDMRTPLASLETLLGSLGRTSADPAEVLELARAQTAHLSSMLRTADATGGAAPRTGAARRLGDVVRASMAACGLPAGQLTVVLGEGAEQVAVGDARVQRILTNLMENAHRHGDGAAVRLEVTRRAGWVDLALTQVVVRPERLLGHLRTQEPPADLTGLGLWSVQRQTRELGGHLVWEGSGAALTLRVQLPDR